ncbi:hypothetical protein [uncultured Proteiniphilum sp.]|uniref:hypothetical protein n=1 Tax=uncultured Proteiniphilum sp. TaxID=497637 RepID=UPI00261FEA0C|nr:hypothetical protein [uncultured Proteiniphilum sp.]
MISLGIFVQGCSSDFDSDVKIENLDIPEEYNEVGVSHNEGLEYIFEEIKALGIEYTKNPRLKSRPFMENKDEFIKQATFNFCNQHEQLQKHIDICKHVLKDSPSLKSSGMENFSPAVQQLLNEITSVLSRKFKENELSRLKALLDVINQKAATTLSEADAAVIYCATSTGYHSYQYWRNNYKKWYFALNYPEIMEQYNNEELHQLQLKNGKIRIKGWWDDIWDTVEDWWDAGSDAVSTWWDNNGSTIVESDSMGAAAGILYAIDSGAATVTMVFGPEGWVLTIAGAATSGAVYSSAIAAVWL